MEEKIIRISVRSLVEFILREGDIDNRISAGMEKDAMMMGSRLHRKIQRRMGSDYHAEVALKIQVPCDGFLLQVEGRADGIIYKEGASEVTVDKRRSAGPGASEGARRDASGAGEMLRLYLCEAGGT